MTNKKMNLYFFTMLIISSFFISQKSHASEFVSGDTEIRSLYYNGDILLVLADSSRSKWNCGIQLFQNSTVALRAYRYCDENDVPLSNENGSNSSFSVFYYGTFSYQSKGFHTAQDCYDRGLSLAQIPTGFPYEGDYICAPEGYGTISPEPDLSDKIHTPEQFDEWICGQDYIKNKLTYNYFPENEMIDYRVRRSLSAGQITGSDNLEIMICGDSECTFDKIVSKVREHISFAPEERIHGFQNEFGGYSNYEVFAYCKAAIKQKSTSDLTADLEVDCRKGIYQFTGESGSSLSNLPESSCYEEENRDYSFKQWCEAQFSEDVYWVEGQLEEYCDPPEKQVSEEKVDDGEVCEVTTEVLDVGYNTDQSRNDITKTIKKKVITKNCDGEIISEEIIESTITVDKTEIQGDGSDKPEDDECFVGPSCPPSKGTGEGTGEGAGESEAGSDSGTNWGSVTPSNGAEIFDIYTPVYTEDNALELIFNKHLGDLENSQINDLFNDMNPFSNSINYDFPKFHLDLNSEDFEFGEYTIDLENFGILDTNINLISILKAVLLLIVAYYCIKEIF